MQRSKKDKGSHKDDRERKCSLLGMKAEMFFLQN
jgi:hypothetical protein